MHHTIIALLDFPKIGFPEGQSYKIPEERFGKKEEVWKLFNPINKTDKLRKMKLLIITADSSFDRTMNENFAAKLKEQDIPYKFICLKGAHTFQVVAEALPYVIEFMNENLAKGL